jgi:hypothetical protein
MVSAGAGSAWRKLLVIRYRFVRFSIFLVSALAIVFPSNTEGQTASGSAQPAADAAQTSGTGTSKDNAQTTQDKPAEKMQRLPESPESQRERAEEELHRQEHQRVLGVIPNFNSTDNLNALPLTPRQKFQLAFRSAIDPFQFLAAALDAGYSQAENEFDGYGEGIQGYGKRFGAAYTDGFTGTILGNAVFPTLLHEDPRYFRKGSGSLTKRFFYAVSTTLWSRRDNGTWGPNYANVLGNVAAGGLSNIYYPSTDRGASLTFERAATVTAEGTFGAVLVEFWPDIAKRFSHKRRKTDGTAEPASETTPPTTPK